MLQLIQTKIYLCYVVINYRGVKGIYETREEAELNSDGCKLRECGLTLDALELLGYSVNDEGDLVQGYRMF